MAFAGISYLSVVLAAVAGWLAGAVWYGVLGTHWLRAIGKTREGMRVTGFRAAAPFIVSFLAELVMAHVLAGAIGHLGPGQVTLRNALISAAILWVGFVATTTVVNNGFEQRPFALTLINAGHWLVVLLVMGLVIGLMGAG